MIQYDFTISGSVQGVGFRQFVVDKARELELKGWVKNTPDGDVRVMVQGDKSALGTLEDYLKTGPSSARVQNVSKYKVEEPDDFSGFTIKN
ncbi:MAG: acylphosphatase [Prolixibacteraceae bacterium]